MAQYLGNQIHAQAEGETDGHDKSSLSVDFLRRDDADTGCGSRTEQRQRSADHFCFGHQRKYQSHGGKQAEQYKKSSGEWYQFFTSKDKELRDTQAELQKARKALEAKEGEQNHGNDKESNS